MVNFMINENAIILGWIELSFIQGQCQVLLGCVNSVA